MPLPSLGLSLDDCINELKDVYRYYSLVRGRQPLGGAQEPGVVEGVTMSPMELQIFLHDSGVLLSSSLNCVDVDLLHKKVIDMKIIDTKVNPNEVIVEMDFDYFLKALQLLAKKIYSEITAKIGWEQAYERLMMKHMLPFSQSQPVEPTSTMRELTTRAVLDTFNSHRHPLKRIFFYYALKPTPGQYIRWTEVLETALSINKEDFEKFCTHFSMYELLSKVDATNMFHQSKNDRFDTETEGRSTARVELSFSEFTVLWLRIADHVYTNKSLGTAEKVLALFEYCKPGYKKVFRQDMEVEGLADDWDSISVQPRMTEEEAEVDEFVVDEEDMAPDVLALCRKIFTHYCTFDDPLGPNALTVFRFNMLMRDFNLVKKKAESEQLFLEVIPQAQEGQKMMFKDFVEALTLIRDRKIKGKTSFDRERKLMGRLNGMFEVYRVKIRPTDKEASKTPGQKPHEHEDGQKLVSIPKRPIRQFDVYCGPKQCAVIEDQPGYLHPVGLISTMNPKHPFLSCQIYDKMTQNPILDQINYAESFEDLQGRLMKSGYDLGASDDEENKTPVGRGWKILTKHMECVGAFWDYKGQFCNLEWVPVQCFASHPQVTMTSYSPPRSLHHDRLWSVYLRATDISKVRIMLEEVGYVLDPIVFSP